MNINEAFRLRNRLKDKIRDLKESVSKAEYENPKEGKNGHGILMEKRSRKPLKLRTPSWIYSVPLMRPLKMPTR